eukprot:COSAG02_NODE_21514_length_785_cov_1.045190_1_plen_63_part_10
MNYRLLKSPLEKDVEVEKCKFIVKPDRVTIKLPRVPIAVWNDLSALLTSFSNADSIAAKGDYN